ncbi:Condensin complex subunit 3 [Porphyridium purpureum]|uniref:Condensin complex subunit 3 n=1 Tax=Porphyridium purpureum TaxID=35688 RepID=A0A5J4Z7Z5_PORPP|nr:Condensin complex subunit 3 [Porphyridium purpureum]|eukprot:POR3311..scf295_1
MEEETRVCARVFQDAQMSFAVHERCAGVLEKRLVNGNRTDNVLHAFVECAKHILLAYSREPPAERLVAFVATFATSNVSLHANPVKLDFCKRFGQFLCDACLNSADKSVRFRACHVLSSMLEKSHDEAWYDATALAEQLLIRTDDKLPRVRATAIEALRFLQDATNPEDDLVTKKLVALMSTDSSSLVRKACLSALSVSSFSLPEILLRLRDTKEDVRRSAYKALGSAQGFVHLDAAARMHVLQCGQSERSETVRRTFSEHLLLKSWYRVACGADTFKFLALFDLQANEEPCIHAAAEAVRCISRVDPDAVFESAADKLDLDSLDFHAAVLMHALCSEPNHHAQILRERLIQSVATYTCAVNYYKSDVAVCHLLLSLIGSQDGYGHDVRADEHGCKELVEVLRTEFLLNPFCDMGLLADVVHAVRFIMQGASNVVDAMLLECAVAHIETDSLTPQDPVRALTILQATLSSMQATERNFAAMIEPLVDRVILPTLQVSDLHSRGLAIQCMALVCLQDQSLVQTVTFAPLFLQVVERDQEQIQIEAVRILVDLLTFVHVHVHAQKQAFDVEAEGQPSLERLAQLTSALEQAVLAPIMSWRSCESSIPKPSPMLATRVQGLCKLILSGAVIADRDIMVTLLTIFHSRDAANEETTSSDSLIQQTLSVFLPAFAFASISHRLVIEDAFMDVLRNTLQQASARKGAAQAWRAAQYMAFLTGERPRASAATKLSTGGQKSESVHAKLATTILSHLRDLMSQRDSVFASVLVRVLSRLLNSLDLASLHREHESCRELSVLLESCERLVWEDKRAMTYLQSFGNKLNEIDSASSKQTSIQQFPLEKQTPVDTKPSQNAMDPLSCRISSLKL